MTAGLYIHIPFCEKRCSYCDFYTLAHRQSTIPEYIQALKKEIRMYARYPEIQALEFDTIYFGGGTPSLLTVKQIREILDSAYTYLKISFHPEITLEVNPGTVDRTKLRGYRTLGVNRLSLGIQSFQPQELQFLDRIHSAEEAIDCFYNARAVDFTNLGIDLIFAIPGQKLQTWEKNLNQAVSLEPEHISAYNLTFEDGTPLTHQVIKGKIRPVSEALQRKMFLTTIDFLQGYGYEHYEISNYARPNFKSRHNQKYWNGSPYLGVGASAHSFIGTRRFWNVSNLNLYLQRLSRNELPVEGEEILGKETLAFEKVFLGLRQRQGVHLSSFEAETGLSFFERYWRPLSRFFHCNFHDSQFITELKDGKRKLKSRLLAIEDGFLRLTRQGILLCDKICAEFV